ncbi:type II secretion system GspH family protein [bacterium]|nr:type II secretion system GspH family protein [bacterium]
MLTINIEKRRKKKGFTLVEFLVAIGLFSIVMVLVTNIFLTLSNARQIAQQKADLKSELRFLLDTLGRELTWTIALPIGCDAATPCSDVTFVTTVRPDVPDKEIRYRFDSALATVFKKEQRTFGICATRPLPDECPEQRTLSEKIKVESFSFIIENNEDDVTQVTATVAIRGYLDFKGRRESFSLSSSYTPRFIQNQAALSGSGLVTPEIYSLQQICTIGGPYRMHITWIDDAKYTMHVLVCDGAGCTPSQPAYGEIDSALRGYWFHYLDFPGVWRYSIQLYDPYSDTYGPLGTDQGSDPDPNPNILEINITSPSDSCTSSGGGGGGGGGGGRTTIPSTGPPPPTGGSGGATGEQ